MKKKLCSALVFISCLAPVSAYADVGVPMLAITMPAFFLALIPVIFIEAYVFKRAGFPFKWSLKWNAIANVVTTIIGIPLTWALLVVLEMNSVGGGCQESVSTLPQKIYDVITRAPWLCPFESELHWMVPTASLILLIPFFFISWKIESLIIRKRNKPLDQSLINKTSLRANLTSYALLALYPVSMFFLMR